MDFTKFCDDVMSLDSNIRFSMILNKNGEKVTGDHRKDITPLLNEDEQKMELFHAGQRWASRQNLIHRIGKAKYSITEYEKVKRITFPVDDKHLLLVSTEVTSDHQKTINSILNLITKINPE